MMIGVQLKDPVDFESNNYIHTYDLWMSDGCGWLSYVFCFSVRRLWHAKQFLLGLTLKLIYAQRRCLCHINGELESNTGEF